MTAYKDLSKEELLELKSELEARFEEVKEKGLKLDMFWQLTPAGSTGSGLAPIVSHRHRYS